MRLIYVSGPYRAPTLSGVQHNIRVAELWANRLWRMGFAVICPHKNTAFMDGIIHPDDPDADADAIIGGDIEMIRRSDAIFMLPNWHASKGAKEELARAVDFKKRVFVHNNWKPLQDWVQGDKCTHQKNCRPLRQKT